MGLQVFCKIHRTYTQLPDRIQSVLTATNNAGSDTETKLSYILVDPLTVSDYEGNPYNVVRIGNQLWMKENLKATKYNDGTPIPLVTDNTTWGGLSTPAYCWYNNDPNYKEPYGAMYNWYAINTLKLCPTGWHVPSEDDLKVLEIAIGLSDVESDEGGYNAIGGGKLKEAGYVHWISPNTGASNESGFTALPGGYRTSSGFGYLGRVAAFFSLTETKSSYAWVLQLSFSSERLRHVYWSKSAGISVRCLKY